MSLPDDGDPAYTMAYAPAERIVGWLLGWGKRTKPEYSGKQAVYRNMSPAVESGERNPKGSGGATILGRVFRDVQTALVPRKEYSQLLPFQIKPEYFRKEGAYKNMSKSLRRLRAAAFLLKRGANKSPIPAAQGRV